MAEEEIIEEEATLEELPSQLTAIPPKQSNRQLIIGGLIVGVIVVVVLLTTLFGGKSESKKSVKILTKSFIDLLIINTIIPLKFVYEQARGEVNEESLLKLIQQLHPEKNSIINKFDELKIKAKNAFESQALLELKNNYCQNKKCLSCNVGNFILNK